MTINLTRVAVITAQGRSTFTDQQAASLEAVSQAEFSSAMSPLSKEEIVARLKNADYAGLTPRSVQSIDRSWLDHLPNLKGIAVFATGVDYVDVHYLKEKGIVLSHLPDYSTESVAEHTLGLLLTMSRRIHLSQDRVRGRVSAGTSVLGWELQGRTIGILGLGRIGNRVAELARVFGMRVLGHDPWQQVEGTLNVNLEELLASSDVVSLHFPAQWQGEAEFGKERFARMKPGATLINVSRCALVDPVAVVDAIDSGMLKGYAVDDIFPIGESDERARQQIAEGRILQTGHTAWYSQEVIQRGYDNWIGNLISLARGNPHNVIGTMRK
ncbi:2-hydroxyacid dehydrogenase [Cohnella sp. WQ 127256]|uniref:2-hydroxyacid dehydrogenase n=1 Tax=Cohnella sp. WQ 127256 TaxID=2938790 RepID=UPI0021179E12|nr:2-hydroxyacid dehydrogenase [Cohnella sp. WQ 127256]